jgi:hypothetical protein
MARDKVTITMNRDKAATALSLAGAKSTSEVIDIALDRLIRSERLRRDVAAYRLMPPTAAELALADVSDSDLGDDTDWEALYPDNEA